MSRERRGLGCTLASVVAIGGTTLCCTIPLLGENPKASVSGNYSHDTLIYGEYGSAQTLRVYGRVGGLDSHYYTVFEASAEVASGQGGVDCWFYVVDQSLLADIDHVLSGDWPEVPLYCAGR